MQNVEEAGHQDNDIDMYICMHIGLLRSGASRDLMQDEEETGDKENDSFPNVGAFEDEV